MSTIPNPPVPFRLLPAWLAIGYALIGLVIYLSLNRSPIEIPVTEGDKFGHLLAYATLMLWFSQLWMRTRARAAWAAGFVALGLALEIAQRFTGYRTYDLADLAADAAGVALGWTLAPPRLPNFLRRFEALVHAA